jgi:hypothetical protein
MTEQTYQDQEKVDAYLRIIRERIVAPIKNTELQRSCTATLLLLFAAIDGLGKLLHSEDRAKPASRICCFLDHMGGRYAVQQEALVMLRNSLVHNAINVESFLSNTEPTDDQHLKRVGQTGCLYVCTWRMYLDFVDAFERFCADIQADPVKLKRAADRLEWKEENLLEDLSSTDEASPSPPPPVEFIWAR